MKKAFTLIEFLVVICIIAIVVACLLPIYVMARNHNNISDNYTIISDEWVGGNHIQVIEDNTTHAKTKLVNEQVVSESQ